MVGVTNGRERDISQVSSERSEQVPRARSLPGCVLVCSDRFGIRVRIDVMCCDAPYGMPCFSFYRPRESTGYSEGKRGG